MGIWPTVKPGQGMAPRERARFGRGIRSAERDLIEGVGEPAGVDYKPAKAFLTANAEAGLFEGLEFGGKSRVWG